MIEQNNWPLHKNMDECGDVGIDVKKPKGMKDIRTIVAATNNIIRRCGGLRRRCGGLPRRYGGLGVVSLPMGRPAWVRISARGLPTVWSEGWQITL